MDRRTLLLGLAAVPVASAASANWFTDIKDAVTGHIEDAKGRVFGEHMVVPNAAIEEIGVFDETADGQDSVHWAVGSVSIVVAEGKRYIQLNEDFNSGPLPDGHVYYSSATDINNEADFNSTVQIDAGSLKLGKGASFYEVPMDAELNSVTIWCKRFGEYIGSADVS